MASTRKCSNYSFVPYNLKPVKPSGINCLGKIPGNSSPMPRSGHRCVANNYDIFCFGGFNPDLPRGTSQLFQELWKFNFATGCWTKLSIVGEVPTKLASHSAVLRGNILYTFGGTGYPFGQSSSNKLYACDLKTLEWREVDATGETPQEQYGQAVALNDNELYVVGGTNGYEYTIEVHCLSLKTKEWRALYPKNGSPPERYRHEIAFFDDSIFVFGGGTATKCFGFEKIPTFNIRTQIWSYTSTYADLALKQTNIQKAGYPLKRRCHSLVQQGADVFIYGGYDGIRIFSDVWRFNMNSHCWQRVIEKVPQPTYFHSAALTPNGRLYVYGGVHDLQRTSNNRTSNMYSMWLTIPTLKDMCWDAVQHYHQHWIDASPKLLLLKEGIPKEYVDSMEFHAECG